MNICDERIIKLQERIKNPLPTYSQQQIHRTRKMLCESPKDEPAEPTKAAAAAIEPARRPAEPPAAPLASNKDPGAPKKTPMEPPPRPAERAMEKRDSPCAAENLEASRKVKSGSDASSDSAEPARKLTSYFKSVSRRDEAELDSQLRRLCEEESHRAGAAAIGPAGPGGAPPGAPGVSRRQPSGFELLLHERDAKLAALAASLQELQGFKQRAKLLLAEQLLSLEQKKRLEEKTWLANERLALGEFISVRDGARFVDVWIDGYEFRRVREALGRLQAEKETVDRKRKQLKKKKPSEPPLPADAPGDSNLAPPGCERNLDELREQLNFQFICLTKEENTLKEAQEKLEQRKELFIARQKRLAEEEGCRFGRLGPADKEPKWPLLSNRYQLLSHLGRGGFSEVYLAFDVEELRQVACKIHQLSPHWTETTKSNYIKHILRETQVHRSLSHANIVSHFDTVEIDSHSFCTVLEYCNGSDLGSYLKKYKTLPEKDARTIAKQIFAALKFLSESAHKIIHYDLKPQNILFHNGVVKLSDFGLCKVIGGDETKIELTSQGVGTYWYLPPECFHKENAKISTKVDVWSAGVILFEMLYGVRPFGHDACQERIWKEGIMLKAHSLDFPAKPPVSAETKELIKACLAYAQEERIDVFEAYNLLCK